MEITGKQEVSWTISAASNTRQPATAPLSLTHCAFLLLFSSLRVGQCRTSRAPTADPAKSDVTGSGHDADPAPGTKSSAPTHLRPNGLTT
jgi:hypothetical protein